LRNKITIAIDGPAGSGKSSVSKIVAKKLGLLYIDTGAMYRALTLKAIDNGINLEEETVLIELAHNTKIELIHQEKRTVVLLDGRDVTEKIRETSVTNNVFYLARTEGVRECMKKLQRKIEKVWQKYGLKYEQKKSGQLYMPLLIARILIWEQVRISTKIEKKFTRVGNWIIKNSGDIYLISLEFRKHSCLLDISKNMRKCIAI